MSSREPVAREKPTPVEQESPAFGTANGMPATPPDPSRPVPRVEDEVEMPAPVADAGSGISPERPVCVYCGKPIRSEPTWVPSMNAQAHRLCFEEHRSAA